MQILENSVYSECKGNYERFYLMLFKYKKHYISFLVQVCLLQE